MHPDDPHAPGDIVTWNGYEFRPLVVSVDRAPSRVDPTTFLSAGACKPSSFAWHQHREPAMRKIARSA